MTGLSEGELAEEPMAQFARWYAEAQEAGQPEPEAMAVATADGFGAPSVRFVLLKRHDAAGFVFYTNRTSRKADELAANARVALAWRWHRLDRQVRVTGQAAPTDDADSDAYFATRPRGSRLGAWASPQSQVVADRATLEAQVAAAEERFRGVDVERPPWWGGYRITPEVVEFWQGRDDRLHDRLRYLRAGGGWVVERLAP